MEHRPRTGWLLAAALALASLATSALAAEPVVVADVKVEGNRRVEVDTIKATVTRKGALYDTRRVEADVRALMKLGFFSDVVVEVEGDERHPVLVYKVTERPTVREATIVGNDELSKEDLKDSVEVKPFTILDLVAVKKDVKKIQEKYVEKGYYLADVAYKLEGLPDNQVAIRYTVDEKAKVLVKEIRFHGNQRLSSAELRGVMLTQEGGLLSILGSAGTFREDMFQRDLAAIGMAYMDQGFVNVKVGKPSIGLSPDRRFLLSAHRGLNEVIVYRYPEMRVHKRVPFPAMSQFYRHLGRFSDSRRIAASSSSPSPSRRASSIRSGRSSSPGSCSARSRCCAASC